MKQESFSKWPLRSALAVLTLGTAFTSTALSACAQTQDIRQVNIQYSFTGAADGDIYLNGGNLAIDKAGVLYGVADGGSAVYGHCACGVLFSIGPDKKFTIIHQFPANAADGAVLASGVILDSAGNQYGETRVGSIDPVISGRSTYYGTVYKIDTSGNETILHNFTQAEAYPEGGLTLDADGNLYGVAMGDCGAGEGCGEIFKLDAKGNETVLYTFSDSTKGSNPSSNLILTSTGDIYGTTRFGGPEGEFNSFGDGVLFKLTADGTFTDLYQFIGGADGAEPGGIALDADGNIYGYTEYAGHNYGGIFKFDTKSSAFSALLEFRGEADGGNPQGIPTLIDGKIYGTTSAGGSRSGGSPGAGVAFSVDATTGAETILHNFGNPTNGQGPVSGLVLGPEKKLFGATSLGGDIKSASAECLFVHSGCGLVYDFSIADLLQ